MYTLLERATSLYDIPAGILHPLRGGHFSRVFSYTRNEKPYIFRVTPPNEDINLSRMLTILDWMEFLAAHGAAVPRIVRSKSGSLLEVIEQNDGEHLIMVTEAAPGVLSEEFPLDRWNDMMFVGLGRSVGKLHALARGYTPARGDFPHPDWHTAEKYAPPPLDDPAQAAAHQKFLEAIGRLQALPRDPGGYGITHADLHFGNFFIDTASDLITIFDFDDCAYGWFIQDVAMLLFDVMVLYQGKNDPPEAFAARFLRNFFKGYLFENPLNVFWIRQLPSFLKYIEIDIYFKVYQSFQAGEGDWWVKKFMPGRKERIEADVPYVNLAF